jgi:hypothetical protein
MSSLKIGATPPFGRFRPSMSIIPGESSALCGGIGFAGYIGVLGTVVFVRVVF